MRWTRAVPAGVAAVLLALGLFGFDWRRLEFEAELSIGVSPWSVTVCSPTGDCDAGEKFGIDLEPSLHHFGEGYATLMHVAFIATIAAIIAQLALCALLATGQARDRWWPRILATVVSFPALVVIGVIAYATVSTPGQGHSGPGLWLAFLGAILATAAPLVRSKPA